MNLAFPDALLGFGRPFEPLPGDLAGDFQRDSTCFHDRVSTDENATFPLEPNRYVLIVSLGCPWSHICVIVRFVAKLEPVVGLCIVEPYCDSEGWVISVDSPGFGLVQVGNLTHLYKETDPSHTTVGTVPCLFDRESRKIVCDGQIGICEMFSEVFPLLVDSNWTIPEGQDVDQEKISHFVWHYVNNGVYRSAPWMTTPDASALRRQQLFLALDWLDQHLETRRYLLGNESPSVVDWQLFATLVRFDFVYYVVFKCNKKHVRDYPNLCGYVRDLYQVEGIAETTDFEQIQGIYHDSKTPNLPGYLPIKSALEELNRPHLRDELA